MRGDVDPRLGQLREIIEQPEERAPNAIAAVAKSRANLEEVAELMFANLDNLQPMFMPQRVCFSRTDVLAKWRNGVSTIPDDLKAEFATWLEAATRRSNAVEENKRRLRSTMWAEVTMRPVRHDYAEQFADFHRAYWRIARVSDDMAERERQIESAVKYL